MDPRGLQTPDSAKEPAESRSSDPAGDAASDPAGDAASGLAGGAASDPAGDVASDPAGSPLATTTRAEEDDDEEQRRVRVLAPNLAGRGRASSHIEREEFEERLPRSTPDALRYEPGVFIQQTAHGQASPYIRGLTGQQTVMFFDGVRINNSTFRQGPNQYFFTVDSRTLARLEVIRGSASTRWGSDALGGALLSTPIDPRWASARRFEVHGRGFFRTGSADGEVGGRGQAEVAYRDKVAVMMGVGYRMLGQLRSGGPVIEPATGEPQKIPPAFEADGKTQRGTGFRELTADARLLWKPRAQDLVTVAYYDYRQFDAPRTDKCPPQTAPLDECLTYRRQFRTLLYGAYAFERGPAAASRGRVTLSYQRQLEDGAYQRGSPSRTRLDNLDRVHSFGGAAHLSTRRFHLGRGVRLGGDYGVDAYYDRIRSTMELYWGDVDRTFPLTRGQYLDGGQYLTSGVWVELDVDVWSVLQLRAGGRASLVHARAAGDPASESSAVRRTWGAAVGHVGALVEVVPGWTFMANVDQGFRAPNLDDLTSRQQTGPGFQFENADLHPERAVTFEGGSSVRSRWISLDAWIFQTMIRDLIGRTERDVNACPQNAQGCESSQTRFQLDNLSGRARLWGVEGSARLTLPAGVWSRATITWAHGEQPNPFGRADEGTLRVPMSRVPPLHGTAEVGWRAKFGLGVAGALRWARRQDRLAPQDIADARIPRGGTPGYVVFDVRLHYRLFDRIFFVAILENLGDTPWRAHGSSVYGPGRSVMVEAQFAF